MAMIDKHNEVIKEQADKILHKPVPNFYNVKNITSEKFTPGFVVNLTKGQVQSGEIGIATLAEVQSLCDYIRVMD